MILIRCPYCSELRSEEELTSGGEAYIARPSDPRQVTDAQWTDYLYTRGNRKGLIAELWCCTYGCGQWFLVNRDSISHRVYETKRFDEPECGQHVLRHVVSDP